MSNSSAINFGTSHEIISINDELDNQVIHRIKNDKNIYISPTGNDVTGDGTSALPYATLKQAFSSIQKYRIDTGKKLHIILKDGEYTVDENFGPDYIGEIKQGEQSVVELTGLTASALISLSPSTHPDIDRIVIRGETKTELPINDLNGQFITNDDGITCSYNHVVGITSGQATPGGISAAEDDFNFSMSLDLANGDSLSTGFDGVATNDYLFVRAHTLSTRMSRIQGNSSKWYGIGAFTFFEKINGEVTNSNTQWSYRHANETSNSSSRGIDTPRELTRYVILGAHTVTGVTGQSNTGTGPGDVAGNHAINTTQRKYIIDDKNFAYRNDLPTCYNPNFIANDYHCRQDADKRNAGTLVDDNSVDIVRQLVRTTSEINELTDIENDQGMVSAIPNVGDVYDGVTSGSVLNPAIHYQNGISAGGSWGSNTRFTLDPASPNPNIGLTGGDAGEYRKDGHITATKYGAVLKLANTTVGRQSVFVINNCNPTIKDLAIVGEYGMSDQYQGDGVGTPAHGFDIVNNAHVTIEDVGISKICYAIRVIRSKANLNKITIDQASRSFGSDSSEVTIKNTTISGNYGASSFVVWGGSQVLAQNLFIVASKGESILVEGGGTHLQLLDSVILWSGQGYAQYIWFCPIYKATSELVDSISTATMRQLSATNGSWTTGRSHGQSAVVCSKEASIYMHSCSICWQGTDGSVEALYGGRVDIHNSLIATGMNMTLKSYFNSHIYAQNNLHFLSHGWMFNAHTNSSMEVRRCINYGHNIRHCYYWSGMAHINENSHARFENNVSDQTFSVSIEPNIGNIAGNGRQHGAYWDSIISLRGNHSMNARHCWDMAEQHRGRFIETNHMRTPSDATPSTPGAPNPLSQKKAYGSSDGSRHFLPGANGAESTVFGQSYINTDIFEIGSGHVEEDNYTHGVDGLSSSST